MLNFVWMQSWLALLSIQGNWDWCSCTWHQWRRLCIGSRAPVWSHGVFCRSHTCYWDTCHTYLGHQWPDPCCLLLACLETQEKSNEDETLETLSCVSRHSSLAAAAVSFVQSVWPPFCLRPSFTISKRILVCIDFFEAPSLLWFQQFFPHFCLIQSAWNSWRGRRCCVAEDLNAWSDLVTPRRGFDWSFLLFFVARLLVLVLVLLHAAAALLMSFHLSRLLFSVVTLWFYSNTERAQRL